VPVDSYAGWTSVDNTEKFQTIWDIHDIIITYTCWALAEEVLRRILLYGVNWLGIAPPTMRHLNYNTEIFQPAYQQFFISPMYSTIKWHDTTLNNITLNKFQIWKYSVSLDWPLSTSPAEIHTNTRAVFFFNLWWAIKKKTNWHNIIILLPKVQQGLTYFST